MEDSPPIINIEVEIEENSETESEAVNAEEEQREKKKAYNRQYKASISKEQRALYKANERLRAETKAVNYEEDQVLPIQKRKPRRILTEEQRLRKIEADRVYRASLTDKQREKLRAKYRERTRTMTEEQRERRQNAQRKYHASLTKEQRNRRKMRERERLILRDVAPPPKTDEILPVEQFKRWTMLPMEQREKRETCPRTYGSTMTKEQRELRKLKSLVHSNLSVTGTISNPSETLTLPIGTVIKIENNMVLSNLVNESESNNTIQEDVKIEPIDLFESDIIKIEKTEQ